MPRPLEPRRDAVPRGLDPGRGPFRHHLGRVLGRGRMVGRRRCRQAPAAASDSSRIDSARSTSSAVVTSGGMILTTFT